MTAPVATLTAAPDASSTNHFGVAADAGGVGLVRGGADEVSQRCGAGQHVESSTAAAVLPSLSARRDSERASRSSAVIAFAEGGSGRSVSSSVLPQIVLSQRDRKGWGDGGTEAVEDAKGGPGAKYLSGISPRGLPTGALHVAGAPDSAAERHSSLGDRPGNACSAARRRRAVLAGRGRSRPGEGDPGPLRRRRKIRFQGLGVPVVLFDLESSPPGHVV